MDLPVAIMSFNRPDYLEMTLQTLMRQAWPEDATFSFFLFQDGSVNPISGKTRASRRDIEACKSVFLRYVPDGVVMESEHNLGVALNFDRAERFFFVEGEYPAALFFEDDMLLAPDYVDVLVRLLRLALNTDHVGMVAAYGAGVSMPQSIQAANRSRIVPMNEHNWGFAITRAHWLARNTIVSEYLDIVRAVDYADRGTVHPEIFALIARYGHAGKRYLSSQDSVKNMASRTLGWHRVTSYTNHARYVGAKGLHMDEDRFRQRGYHQTIIFEGAVGDFEMPTRDELKAMEIEQSMGLMS